MNKNSDPQPGSFGFHARRDNQDAQEPWSTQPMHPSQRPDQPWSQPQGPNPNTWPQSQPQPQPNWNQPQGGQQPWQQAPQPWQQQPYGQYPPPPPPPQARPRRKPMGCCSCFFTSLLFGTLALVVILGVYFLAPFRTNLLLLGIDRTEDGSATGRSDTIILTSVVPLAPTVSMLSIPRDLWLNIPGVGENRINTAHFFAEAQQPGSGPQATIQTLEENFNVEVPYYVRIRFDSFMNVVDAMGGVTVNLPQDMAGLPAGEHHLDSQQALAFVRDRSGTDDFFRMEHGQFLMRAILRQLIQPSSWSYLPSVLQSLNASVDTNVPLWQFPRLGLAVLRAGADGIDSRTVQREMTIPHVTDGGAQVLLPKWDEINPVVDEMFGR